MSAVDPTVIAAQYQAVGAQLSSLGQQLPQSARSGNFSSVLAQMQSALDSVGSTASADTASVSGSPGGLSTASLLSLAGAGTAGASSSGAAGTAVVADAERYLGVPYQWGGTNPATGFDCSGLVQHVYADLGVSLPRTSEEQATVGTPVAGLADAQPGDLVFFAGSDGTASSPGHVGIYIGNGEMIDAPQTGETVQIQPVGQPVAIRRVLPAPETSGAGEATLLAAQGGGGASGIPASLGVPAALVPLFEQAGQAEGVSPALLAAVAKQESGFRSGAVSSTGAEGIMQLEPGTAAGLGANPYDPSQAITAAATLLRGYLNDYGGSVPLALAAYNAGPGAVAEYGGVPPYAQTQNYVASITSMLGEEAA